MPHFKTENILGQSGDAIIQMDERQIYVPYLLENEEIEADYDGDNLSNVVIKNASPDRCEAVCDVFEKCGGCAFQHMSKEKYQSFKLSAFKEIFKDIYNSENIQSAFCDKATRRRTVISIFKNKDDYVWGYKAKASKKIINFSECHVVTKKLNDFIQRFVPFLKEYVSSDVQVKLHITEAENGFDLVVRGCKPPKDKAKVIMFKALENDYLDVMRITWEHEIFYQKEVPFILIDNKPVSMMPEMFLQPSVQGQNILTDIIFPYFQKLGKKTQICDLFAGAGTFTLPLSNKVLVDAYDNADGALQKLSETVKEFGLQKRIQAFHRDLYRDPVSVLELKKYDAILTDPPRNGMLAQVKNIAKAKNKMVVMVFCDPYTAYRDAKILCDAGYKIDALYAVDQFVFSKHIEGVAIFRQ